MKKGYVAYYVDGKKSIVEEYHKNSIEFLPGELKLHSNDNSEGENRCRCSYGDIEAVAIAPCCIA